MTTTGLVVLMVVLAAIVLLSGAPTRTKLVELAALGLLVLAVYMIIAGKLP